MNDIDNYPTDIYTHHWFTAGDHIHCSVSANNDDSALHMGFYVGDYPLHSKEIPVGDSYNWVTMLGLIEAKKLLEGQIELIEAQMAEVASYISKK